MAGGEGGTQGDSAQDRHGHEGTLIAGRYRLVERLGAGGMGRVWRAHDEQLGVDVALKEVWLPPMLSDAERADRLARAQREARNAARLRNHPHIVSIHDMVDDREMPWIVMDLIPSRNLSQVVAEHGPLPLDQVATIGMGVLEALAASHAAGILHRDVKPANVLLTNDGRVLLTDFGIAVQESDLTMTSSGVLVGSPEYVAPERARGEASKASSDLFSLGATLYYAAEGKSPFARETAVGVLTAILFEDAAAVSRQPRLATLINGLLDKDPERRFDTARTRQELTRLGGGSSLRASRSAGPAATMLMPETEPAPTNGTPDPTLRVPPQAPLQPTPAAFQQGAPQPMPMPQPLPPQNPWQQQRPAPVGPPMGQQGLQGAGQQGLGPQGPSWPPMGVQIGPPGPPPKKNNNGRNAGIAVVSVLAVGGIIAAIILSGGKKNTNNDSILNANNTNTTAPRSVSSPTAPATTVSPTDNPTTDTPTTADSTTDVNPPTASAFNPRNLDIAATDSTPLTADALLPQSFTDDKGVVFTMKSSGVENCVNNYESSHVKDILNGEHCVNAVVGTYVDASNQILVAVQVMAMVDKSTAVDAYNNLKSAFSNDWGIWCPKDGPGSQICNNGEDISQAEQYGYLVQSHRYLIHSLSLYINLTQDTTVKPWVVSSSDKAANSAGPQNYIGNQ